MSLLLHKCRAAPERLRPGTCLEVLESRHLHIVLETAVSGADSCFCSTTTSLCKVSGVQFKVSLSLENHAA
jgi:hypothetical protein